MTTKALITRLVSEGWNREHARREVLSAQNYEHTIKLEGGQYAFPNPKKGWRLLSLDELDHEGVL